MALVLCTGSEAAVMTTRKLILEQAGHTVVMASDDRQVEKACKKHSFDVVVIGQNTSPAVKQRLVRIIREHCSPARILELHRPFSDKALPDADEWLAMPGEYPGALADAVAGLAQRNTNKEIGSC